MAARPALSLTMAAAVAVSAAANASVTAARRHRISSRARAATHLVFLSSAWTPQLTEVPGSYSADCPSPASARHLDTCSRLRRTIPASLLVAAPSTEPATRP